MGDPLLSGTNTNRSAWIVFLPKSVIPPASGVASAYPNIV